MGQGRDKLITVLKIILDQKENKNELIPALQGRYNEAGQKEVAVPTRNNYIWVRLRGQSNELTQAFNDRVGLNFNEPVLVQREPLNGRFYVVVSRDISLYGTNSWTNTSGLVFHGEQHSFSSATNVAKDIVWIYKRQMVQPFLVQPTSPPSMIVSVDSDYYLWDNQFKFFAGGNSASLSAYIPTGGFARYVTVYLDGTTNTVGLLPGTPFSILFPSDIGLAASIPSISGTVGMNLASVLLTALTTSIKWSELYDLRVLISSSGAFSTPGVHNLDPAYGSHSGTLPATYVITSDSGPFAGADVDTALEDLDSRIVASSSSTAWIQRVWFGT